MRKTAILKFLSRTFSLVLSFSFFVPVVIMAQAGFTIYGEPCPIETQGTQECNYDQYGNYLGQSQSSQQIRTGNNISTGPNISSGGVIGQPESGGRGCSVTGTPKNFSEVLCIFVGFINTALPTIVGMALLVFFWGLIQAIRGSGDENKVSEGKQLMFWGVIALFVMISFVGILNLFYSDFFGGTIGIPQLPQNP